MESIKDIFIIGGGINGTGIAADAAGRGLTVSLCEQGDLASGTSSCSTKLIHGGLRYLEQFKFSMVKNALREREILLKKAPHLISPLEFVLPYENHLRPAWMIRMGLFLYDHLASRQIIPRSGSIQFAHDQRGIPLHSQYVKGFSYYDCMTDDARLVIENALAAKENGAEIMTHTVCISANKQDRHWKIHLKNLLTHEDYYYKTKVLINAAGPWIQEINQRILHSHALFSTQLVKGSHIVIPKLYDGDYAYILQNPDKRIVFAIPYQNQFTLIGTTDVPVDHMHHIAITEQEIAYLCKTINNYFKKSISPQDVVWSYSGVRCLQNAKTDNPTATTRDYKILFDTSKLPLVTIIGGKITTFRMLAEECVNLLGPLFPGMGKPWTADQYLPGWNLPHHRFDIFYEQFRKKYPWLPDSLAYRYAKNYGTRAYQLLQHASTLEELGDHFGAGLYEQEVNYLIKHEWALSAQDILWRRTKLGLVMNKNDQEKLSNILHSR